MRNQAVHAGAGEGRATEGRALEGAPALSSAEDAAAIAMSKMRSMAARSDRPAVVWRRCSEATRRFWLIMCRRPFSLAAFPWDRLDDTDKQTLKAALEVSMEFFERAGRDHLKGQP